MKLVSELDNLNLESLLIIFFNATDQEDGHFEVRSGYRKSVHAPKDLEYNDVEYNNYLLNEYSELNFEIKGNGGHVAYLKNDLNYNFSQLFKKLFSLIQQKRFDYESEIFDRKVINCAYALRGSIDMNRGLMALDIYDRILSEDYIQLLTTLLLNTESSSQLNLNFRNLQKQFVENKNKRNTQVRVNIRWFYDNCLNELEKVNKYKADILKNRSQIILQKNYFKSNNSFLERIIFYRERIVNTSFSFDNLSESELKNKIKELREQLNFDNEYVEEKGSRRNKQIVLTADAILPDECVACKDYYSKSDRTFKKRNSDKHYFELHHVISFGAKQSGDILENLVKLCPACHRALTPNRAEESYQKEIIKNILLNSNEANDYVGNFIKEPDNLDMKIDYVYSNLK